MDSDLPTTGKGPVANLAARRAAGQLRADPVQERIVQRLQAVHDRLAPLTRQPPAPEGGSARGAAAARHPAAGRGFRPRLGWAAGDKPVAGPHGLYIWGPVGRGK